MKKRVDSKLEEARWRFVSGFVAGVTSRTFIAPIERYIILRQTGSQQYFNKSLKYVVTTIYGKEGPSSLFKGNGANCMRVGPQLAIESMFFDSFVFNVIPKLEKYWDRHLLMLFFGAISGGIAISVVYPFDVARTLLASGENYKQLQNVSGTLSYLYTKVGISAFYRGIFASLLGVVPFASIKLTMNNIYMKMLKQNFPRMNQKLRQILTGALSGATALSFVYPLDVIRRKQHMQLMNQGQRSKSYWRLINEIHSNSGLKGFYVGLAATYVKVFPSTAVFQVTYQNIKKMKDMN